MTLKNKGVKIMSNNTITPEADYIPEETIYTTELTPLATAVVTSPIIRVYQNYIISFLLTRKGLSQNRKKFLLRDGSFFLM